jgi:hypothetical protein
VTSCCAGDHVALPHPGSLLVVAITSPRIVVEGILFGWPIAARID